MMLNMLFAACVILSIYMFCVKDNSVFFNRYDRPIIPFRGVLISWDILAMKLDLNSFAASASPFASSKSSWICFLWRISFLNRAIQKNETTKITAIKTPMMDSMRIIGP